MQAAKDLRTLASAAGIADTAKGTEGSPVDTMQYGEFITATAPDTCTASSEEVKKLFDAVYEALCDDINTPIALSHIFDAVRLVNSAKAGELKLSKGDLETLTQLFDDIVFGVLGLKDESAAESGKGQEIVSGLMDMVLEERAKAKAAKDWAASDAIRDHLKALGITVKDTKDGAEWSIQ